MCAGIARGWLSLDQVGVIAQRAAEGIRRALCRACRGGVGRQLRAAVRLERDLSPIRCPNRSGLSQGTTMTHSATGGSAAPRGGRKVRCRPGVHRDALIAEGKQDHGPGDSTVQLPPFPDTVDALMRLIEAGWDADAIRRPHGHHHRCGARRVEKHSASLHLGPPLGNLERGYLTRDAACEVWFETSRRGHRSGGRRG